MVKIYNRTAAAAMLLISLSAGVLANHKTIVNRTGYKNGYEPRDYVTTMIRLLAELFREFHYIIGISLPPPSTGDRTFVFSWLSVIAIITAFSAIMFVYIIPFLYFKH